MSVPAPAKLVKLVVVKPAGPTPTAMKRAAASLACDVLGAAFAKLTDAQAAKLGTDKATVGLKFATALNYIPTPTDHWHPALPDRSFAGGRGTKARRA